jgi:pimeloyl-ACP methyl ester carboxylesterase
VSKPTPGSGPRAAFTRAYQQVVDRWPVPVTEADLPTDYGSTHALISGAANGPVVLLLPGGGATATAWSAVAGELAPAYRTVALDPVGQPGRSARGRVPLRTAADLTGWLDQVLDGLGVRSASVVGHSYGAWIALRYALHAPARLERLVLLDPTACLAPMSLRDRWRAIPLMIAPQAPRVRRLLAWETGDRRLDPEWLAVVAAGADLGRYPVVVPRQPSRPALDALRVPVLVIAAGRSRALDPGRLVQRARDLLPSVTAQTLALASHHSIPTEDAVDLAGVIRRFLALEDDSRA